MTDIYEIRSIVVYYPKNVSSPLSQLSFFSLLVHSATARKVFKALPCNQFYEKRTPIIHRFLSILGSVCCYFDRDSED